MRCAQLLAEVGQPFQGGGQPSVVCGDLGLETAERRLDLLLLFAQSGDALGDKLRLDALLDRLDLEPDGVVEVRYLATHPRLGAPYL